MSKEFDLTQLLSADMAKLVELNRALQDAKDAVSAHKAEMTKHCEVKIGDEVLCNGHSHKGKTIVVDRVWLHDMYGGKYQFRASGKIKKKNGEIGGQVGEWYQNR